MKTMTIFLSVTCLLFGIVLGMSLYKDKVTQDSLSSLKQWQSKGGKIDCETIKYIDQFKIYNETCGEK